MINMIGMRATSESPDGLTAAQTHWADNNRQHRLWRFERLQVRKLRLETNTSNAEIFIRSSSRHVTA